MPPTTQPIAMNTILSIENVTTCSETVTVTVSAVLDNAKPGPELGPDLCRAVLFLDSLEQWPQDEQDQIAFITAYDPCWE